MASRQSVCKFGKSAINFEAECLNLEQIQEIVDLKEPFTDKDFPPNKFSLHRFGGMQIK